MYTDDLAKMYGFDKEQVETFISNAGFEIKSSFTKKVVQDSDVGPIVNGFHRYLEEEAKKQKVMSSIMITSGFGFEGYRIKKYGLFSQTTNVGQALMKSIVEIRRNALMELKVAAYDLGCNAVIGVDFDYITLDPETANANGGTLYLPYVFGVTANGNAVVIEKDSPGN